MLCHHPDGHLGPGKWYLFGVCDSISGVMKKVHLDHMYLAGNSYTIFRQEAKDHLTAGEGEVLGTTDVSQPPCFRREAEAAPGRGSPSTLSMEAGRSMSSVSSGFLVSPVHGPETLSFRWRKSPPEVNRNINTQILQLKESKLGLKKYAKGTPARNVLIAVMLLWM